MLAAFERSGDSAAAFAREHGIAYTTFCSWRHQQPAAVDDRSPSFVEIALDGPTAQVGLLVEVGPRVRIRLSGSAQVGLAAQLIQALEDGESC